MNKQTSGRAGLLIAGLWFVCITAMVLALIGGGVVSFRQYGGIIPAYSTLSSGYWSGFTQTAGAPASQTWQVFYNQTSTAGVVPSMTGQAAFEQTGTAGYIPGLTEQAYWGHTLTAGVPATATANAIATQGAP